MTIFIPEYIIYWSNCPNLFLIEYSPSYIFIIDTLFFDFDNYSLLYKTGAFNKSGWVKYPKWIHYNFYKNKGVDVLRCRLCEKFFFFKKFGVRRLMFRQVQFIDYFLMNDVVFRYTDTFDFLGLVKEKQYFTESRNWMSTYLHPKKWRWGIAKLHKVSILQTLKEEIIWTLHFDTWDKLCLYSLGGLSNQYWVNLVNFGLYDFYDKNWFNEIYIFKFFSINYYFFILYRSILPLIFEIYIHLYFILLIPIKFYLFYLFYHFFYDLGFLLFFYNKFIIKLVLQIYYIIIGFYINIIFWISSIRMFKKTVMGKNYDLESLLYVKKYALRNYCYRIFLNRGISKEYEDYMRRYDDCVNYPFFLIYLFKYKLEFFIFLERFSINLSYFFNKHFFIDLLKKYYLRNSISFFNFIIIIFIFCPFYIFLYFIYYIFYMTFFIKYFFKDTLYWYFNIIKYEKIHEDIFRNLLFEKIFEQRYDYLIYWINTVKFEYFTLSYYKKDRERVFKKYKDLIDRPRSIREAPLEDVLFEYWNERNKYAIGAGSGGFKGHNHYIWFNILGGNYIKSKMYLYNHYFEDPFFFSSCLEHLDWGFAFTKIFRITIILNYIQIEYLKNILNQFKLIYSSFWYYYFFIIIFYPFYYVFYFLDWFHFIYLSLKWDTWHIILCKIYLNFIIIKKYLLSFWLIKILVYVISLCYNNLIYVINKIWLYIKNSKRINLVSFEFWKFCILFYFYFLRYKFILKIFRIFFVRLWIIAFSLVVIIFFFDNEELWGFTYHLLGAVKIDNEEWEGIRMIFDPNYSFWSYFNDNMILFLTEYLKGHELKKCFFDWSIIHMDWIFYIKAWYKLYFPNVNFFLEPFRKLIVFIGLDDKWWLFQLKLFYNMDYGFVKLNNMFVILTFPTFYHVWRNFYDLLIFSYIFFFIDWFHHYFFYRIICFIDMKLNFLFINELLIFIINIFYNILLLLKYYYYLFIINYTKFYYDLWLNQIMDDLLNQFPNLFYLYKYHIFRIYFIYDLVLLIQYYWFYYYHYLYYYSYEFLHNFYNYLVYLLSFVYWGNWQYSTYNLIGAYDVLNNNITMPILVFFHKFFMFFLNSSYNLNYWQQEYPNMFHGYQFPFVITKKQQFTGSTTLNRFFFETWLIKVNILENFFLYGWRYNSRFSSGLFLLSYIYVLIIMFFLVRIFIYAARSFRQMNIKTRLSQSGARLWYRMRPVESRHLFTDLEFDWAYSWDWIYEFPKYRKEFFPLDPITDIRYQKQINYFEGEFVVYRFLTKLFEYKRNQNKKYFGWRVLNAMDKYYNIRYGQVLDVVREIYTHNISVVNNQTFKFTKVDYIFSGEYYKLELNSKWRMYYGHLDRYERYQDLMSYEDFLFRVAMPFLYTYCDDIKYIEYYMKNIGRMRPNLWKFETLLNDKEKHGLNFTEFFFTDKQFYEKFISEFECQDPTTIFGAFIEHRAQNIFNFKPWYRKNTFLLYRPNIFEQFYEWEDYFLKLTQWDEKYFNNIFNLTFYNTFEWPLLVRTKIQLAQLKELFDAFDPFTMLEETQFLPSDSGIIRGDTETDYEIQQRVDHYWTTVIKKTNDDYHNEIGLFTSKVMPLFSYLYGIYLPLLLVSVQFCDTFNIHTNFLDFLPPLFSYIFSTFSNIDMEFSTWAINDPWFVVNPLMGVFITREYGIDIFLTFMGQGYQPWILFNVDISKNYHSSLFIYSFSNVDFYPFENFFSKWEKSFYFYDVLPLTERLVDLPNNTFLIDYPLGYELFHIVGEIKNQRFILMPIINELFGSIVIYILGFLPRMLVVIPLTLMWFFFAFSIYLLLMFRMNTSKYVLEERYYQIKKGRQYFNGLSSKKSK